MMQLISIGLYIYLILNSNLWVCLSNPSVSNSRSRGKIYLQAKVCSAAILFFHLILFHLRFVVTHSHIRSFFKILFYKTFVRKIHAFHISYLWHNMDKNSQWYNCTWLIWLILFQKEKSKYFLNFCKVI